MHYFNPQEKCYEVDPHDPHFTDEETEAWILLEDKYPEKKNPPSTKYKQKMLNKSNLNEKILGWPKRSFRFFRKMLQKPKRTFWPTPINKSNFNPRHPKTQQPQSDC